MTQQQKVDKDKRILGHIAICRCAVSASVDMLISCDSCEAGVRCWVCLSGERPPRLAGEGAWLSGRPRNRLFSNVQLPIIPAVINHPTLTNEVEQSASQSATQHTTTHSPPCLPCCLGSLISF